MDASAHIEVSVNGSGREVPAQTTVAELITLLGLGGRRVAVELNHEVVPRSAHAAHTLKAGDRLEIIHAIGGG